MVWNMPATDRDASPALARDGGGCDVRRSNFCVRLDAAKMRFTEGNHGHFQATFVLTVWNEPLFKLEWG